MTSSDDRLNSLAKNIQTLTFLVIFLIVAVGVLFAKDFLNKPDKASVETAQEAAAQPEQAVKVSIEQIKKLFSKGNIVFGNKNSKNLFVMVSDPSCPYCHIAAGENPQLNQEAGDQFLLEQDGGTYIAPVIKMRELVEQGKAGFVWLYQNGHNNGEMATKALYCAYEQGKFWEAHDLIMNNEGYSLINEVVMNNNDKAPELVNFLSSVVDANKLQSCLDSGKYNNRLSKDMQTAVSLGVSGTPGFFVNTTNFAGAYSWAQMESSLK